MIKQKTDPVVTTLCLSRLSTILCSSHGLPDLRGGGHTGVQAFDQLGCCLLAGLLKGDASAVGSVKGSLTQGEGMTNHP